MEKVILRQAMPEIIKGPNITEGFLEFQNGAWVFTSSNDFKQVLKQSEYLKIMAQNTCVLASAAPAKVSKAPVVEDEDSDDDEDDENDEDEKEDEAKDEKAPKISAADIKKAKGKKKVTLKKRG